MALPAIKRWFRGFWSFYRTYTDSAIHTAATAALAIFGILVFVDPWFAAVAIGCYVFPPVVLYTLADESDRAYKFESEPEPESEDGTSDLRDRAVGSAPSASGGHSRTSSDLMSKTTATVGDTDTDTDDSDADSDSDGTDTDSDTDDGDTDSDSDDGDTDFDGVGSDTDSDSDGTDTDSDSDSDDGDTDSDSDDGDTDSDSDDGDTDSDSDDGDTDSDSDG